MILALITSIWLIFTENPANMQKPHVNAYIDQYQWLAIDEMHRSGIPASIIMAQAIHESNGGTSRLAKESNNHFGIKCKSYWEGDKYFHPDDDYDKSGKLIPSCFRAYESVEASYVDHSEFLMQTAHYSGLFGYSKEDFKHWANGLQLCGYATDCKYAEKLIRTIELYDLDELDLYEVQFIPQSEIEKNSSQYTLIRE